MAATALTPVEQYLSTVYRPDRDFVDGESRERHLGEQPHALVQGFLVRLLGNLRLTWGIRALPEQRVQVRPDRFRIPDIAVLRREDPRDLIVRTPPLLCIEVLSREDTLGELQARIDDYVGMGVPAIWVLDPWMRRGWTASGRGLLQPDDGVLRVEGTPIEVVLADVWTELDEG